MIYNDLTELQLENLDDLLERLNNNQFKEIKIDFPDFKVAARNKDTKINLSHSLMSDNIPLLYIKKVLSDLHLNSANTILYYELKNINKYKKLTSNKKLSEYVSNILDINTKINNVHLVDIDTKTNNQILFSFIMPSTVEKKNMQGNYYFENDIYYSYAWIDFKKQAMIFSLPQYPNCVTINNKIIKKNQFEQIANEIFTVFKTLDIEFKFNNVDWMLPVLNLISKEYFDHNNPFIYDIIKDLESSKEFENIVKQIVLFEKNLDNDFSKIRLKKALTDILETELVRVIGPKKKEIPFEIFLQEVTRGGTDYKANNKKNPFHADEAREIIKSMIEHGETNALGLVHKYNESVYKYRINYSNEYFELKRLTIGNTKKEVVEDVLSIFNKYKQAIQSKPTSRTISKSK